MTRRAVFGVYLGEFGWELCVWNPLVRKMAREFDHVTVIAPPGSRCLYEFADEFVPLEPLPGTSDFMNGSAKHADVKAAVQPARSLTAEHIWPADLDRRTGVVRRELERFAVSRRGQEQPEKEWRRLRAELVPFPGYDVALAFRPEKTFNGRTYADKAYPLELAREVAQRLLDAGYRTLNIGGPDNFDVPCTFDVRVLPLDMQICELSSCRVTVGPSSAPLHLSQLCEIGVVTWYNRPRSESAGRYQHADGSRGGLWNPFDAPCTFLDGVNPSPIAVCAAVSRAVRNGEFDQ